MESNGDNPEIKGMRGMPGRKDGGVCSEQDLQCGRRKRGKNRIRTRLCLILRDPSPTGSDNTTFHAELLTSTW